MANGVHSQAGIAGREPVAFARFKTVISKAWEAILQVEAPPGRVYLKLRSCDALGLCPVWIGFQDFVGVAIEGRRRDYLETLFPRVPDDVSQEAFILDRPKVATQVAKTAVPKGYATISGCRGLIDEGTAFLRVIPTDVIAVMPIPELGGRPTGSAPNSADT